MIKQEGYSFPDSIEIIEVGPRDGLQREGILIPTAEKVTLIDDLVTAGLKRIQVTSFVHPRLVPQMADAGELCDRLTYYPQVIYSGLALNLKGVERAYDAGLTHIDISVSASDAHSRRNANRGLDKALHNFDQMFAQSRAYGMTVRGGIQCAFGYQRNNDVTIPDVVRIARHFLQGLGVDELALADSSGLANPMQVQQMLAAVLPFAEGRPIVMHLHDTRGMGLANVVAAVQCGVRHFDTAFGGLGGCPFIDGVAGNIATEDTAFMLHEMGIETGIDLQSIANISRRFAQLLRKDELSSKLYRLLAEKK